MSGQGARIQTTLAGDGQGLRKKVSDAGGTAPLAVVLGDWFFEGAASEITGELAVTLPTPTLSGDGVEEILGELAGTLATVALSAAGTVGDTSDSGAVIMLMHRRRGGRGRR